MKESAGFKDLFSRPISFREWLAWKIVIVAHKIYDADYYELYEKDGVTLEICSSKYGHGVNSGTGLRDEYIKEFDTWEEMWGYMDNALSKRG